MDILRIASQRIMIQLSPCVPNAFCPRCGSRAERVHSWYWRRAADLPLSGNPVEIRVHARRFFCDEEDCERRIFCERFPGVLDPYARLTDRARRILVEFAHASGAEQAARVARLIGFERSGTSLITLQRRERFEAVAPSVIGIDEFAWRKGFHYGTIIVDLKRRTPIDLLPTDQAEEVVHWFERHPPVSVIARDRGEVFAKAAREAVPGAIQVADRFHLVKNVVDAFREFLLSRRWNTAPRGENSDQQATCGEPEDDPLRERVPTPRSRWRWEQIHSMRREEHTISDIARSLRMNRRTVRKYLRASEPPIRRTTVPRTTKLDPYLDYLVERWNDGVHNAAQLFREIRTQGYRGCAASLRVAVARWRRGDSRQVPKRVRKPDPPPTQLAMRWRRALDEEEAAELDAFLLLNPELTAAYELKETFRESMVARNVAQLDHWIASAASSGIACFQSLAKGMQHDYGAVRASFTSAWSNGQCEGQITRVKLIKRMGYGRAKPDLLRARVLHRMAAA